MRNGSGLKAIGVAAVVAALLSGCVERGPVYDARFDGSIGSPRWFDPAMRCHDAPHNTTSNETFRGRLSLNPGGSCVIEMKPALHSGVTLLGYEVIAEPGEGRVARVSQFAYRYSAPRDGALRDGYVIRMRYSDRVGRIFQPTIRYEVRILPD